VVFSQSQTFERKSMSYQTSDTPKEKRKKIVSYSQYSMWFKCPHHFYLDRVKGLRVNESSLILSYGNAIHETIQEYVKILYTNGLIKATTFKVRDFFIEHYINEITEKGIKFTQDELKEFIEDGANFLKEFMQSAVRLKHFPADKFELLGIEDELSMPLFNNVDYWGFIDLVLKEKATGKIKIFDFKTARFGWNNAQMEDLAKSSQVLLYKALYSKKHNVPLSMIEVEFFIMKRKLYENSHYRQSRIQIFSPEATQKEVTRVVDHFNQFVSECFKEDGTYNLEAKYPKIPGKSKTNCKYCLHKGKTCDAIADIKD
jgi:hypothetical protein